MMYPEPLDYPDTFNTSHRPPPYMPSVNGVPAISSAEGDELEEPPSEPPPAYPDSSPPRVSMMTTATMFTTAYPRPVRNRMVRTVDPDVQIPSIYPGFAFCKFTQGEIETVIRLSVVVRP